MVSSRFRNRRIMSVPFGRLADANAAARMVDPAAEDTFSISTNPSGNPNAAATHYYCNWAMTDEQKERFDAAVATFPGLAAVMGIDDLDDPDPRVGQPNMNTVLARDGQKKRHREVRDH